MSNLSEEDFQKQVTELEKKYYGQMVVADYYQLGRTTGTRFNRNVKELKRPDMTVEIAYFATVNRQWPDMGKLFVINEEKTEQFHESLEAHKELTAKRAKIQKIGADKLATAITSMVDDTTEEGVAEGFKKRNKSFGVNADMLSVKLTKGYDENNYLFTGTKAECETYIETEKAK